MSFKHCLVVCVALAGAMVFPTLAFADEGVDMFRLYNPNTGEHFYTASEYEYFSVAAAGWDMEGTGWVAPEKSNIPVYRLYNPNAGDHHYTLDSNEKDHLVTVGWNYEGIGWYSDDSKTVAVLRQYNPNAVAGAHNFTTAQAENDHLVSVGWRAEGIAWYALKEGSTYIAGSSIMGTSKSSAASMAAYYKAKGATYPSAELGAGGAPTIEDFATIYAEEAAAEGVRADVAFCQAMWETGWLRYGGDVSVGQFNFAGLGATGGGAAGASFPDVRTGVRAQIQHLKAYASTQPLNNACVDPRFHLVTRGVAPTVVDLNGRWAVPGDGYGQNILKLVNQMLNY